MKSFTGNKMVIDVSGEGQWKGQSRNKARELERSVRRLLLLMLACLPSVSPSFWCEHVFPFSVLVAVLFCVFLMRLQ